jgi:hypothetical protein
MTMCDPTDADPKVPFRHAAASEPPLILGLNEHAVRPNLARSTVAQAGNELVDYLERHFPFVKENVAQQVAQIKERVLHGKDADSDSSSNAR